MRRVVLARAKYSTVGARGESAVETTPLPPQVFARSLAPPSLLAHVVMAKHGEGMPTFRLEDRFAREGMPLDRGTMCRWLEDAGATVGASVVQAMRDEALRTAFCIATDATGVAIQPERVPDQPGRKPCRRGHYFVQIADRDHV
jgi:transposase